MKSFPAGYGEPAGDTLLQAKPLLTSGDVWYVLSTSGADAVSPAGKQRLKPLATLAQAITNAADGDDIVLLAGHAQTLTAVQTINKKVRISSGGTGTSRARFTRNHATAKLFDVTVSRVQLRNLYFVQDAQTNSAALVTVGGTECRIKGCYFEGGANNTGPLVDLVTGGDRCRIDDTTLISVAVEAQPAMAIRVANAIADLVTNGLVIDGGTVGWSNQYAMDATAAAVTALFMENTSLLRDSDIGLHSSSTGLVHVGTSSGSARVV